MNTVFPAELGLGEILSKVLLSRKIFHCEYIFKTDEKGMTWDLGIAPIFNHQGELLRLILSAHDMTERKKLEEQFRQAQELQQYQHQYF